MQLCENHLHKQPLTWNHLANKARRLFWPHPRIGVVGGVRDLIVGCDGVCRTRRNACTKHIIDVVELVLSLSFFGFYS